jgi:hypothetical protein
VRARSGIKTAGIVAEAYGAAAVAKSAVKAGAKDLIVGIERYYMHVEPGWLHLRRRRRKRRAA